MQVYDSRKNRIICQNRIFIPQITYYVDIFLPFTIVKSPHE
ncbi:hypothetical protein BBKW_1605 [Bifidobacterium catenulatum subsp. kashiwanohense JCM 15439 = DSM 21854]|nr:hypothetical protein BBKW_1605 [Bifidobacterium catenulatum subsp. kashiwanohense JCM 15439 = DSM 21854]